MKGQDELSTTGNRCKRQRQTQLWVGKWVRTKITESSKRWKLVNLCKQENINYNVCYSSSTYRIHINKQVRSLPSLVALIVYLYSFFSLS